MKYQSLDIGSILGAQSTATLLDNEIDTIGFDSRKIVFPSSSLFFCIETSNSDGHQYIEDAYKKGVRNFVVSKPIKEHSDANYFQVENTVDALQKLARHHREKHQLQVLAITGSYGKTIVKEWIYQMLFDQFNIARSPKSYNSQIGVPLSLLRISEATELAIIEVGISEKNEMDRLQKITQPQVGILTNIGSAHDEGFADESEKIQEKIKLFHSCDIIIYHRNASIETALSSFKGSHWKWKIVSQKSSDTGTIIGFELRGQHYSIALPFADASSIENAIHATCFLLYKGLSIEAIEKRCTHLPTLSMRLEMHTGINNSIIINDAYIADISSLQMALDFQELNREGKKKILILSDFVIHKNALKSQYKEIQSHISANQIEQLITIGKEVDQYIDFDPHQHFDNIDEAVHFFQENPLKDACVLLKGSRTSRLEKLANFLSNQIHDTILEIDLEAVANNFSIYRSLLQRGTKIVGVVKAGAYGSGIEIAKTLAFHQIDYLAVAFPGEGIELRKAGIKSPIIILNPQKSSTADLEAYNLEPEIYSLEQLKHLSTYINSEINIHINLNTGMNRLGLEAYEIPELVEIVKSNEKIHVASIFSHLSSSEDKNDDAYTNQQATLFSKNAKAITKELNDRPFLHLLNSAGISRFPQYHFDAVRLGIGLYGIDSNPNLQGLKKVHSLKTRIIQIKSHEAGIDIGYNRQGHLSKKSQIATIPIGYADGIPYTLNNKDYHFLVNGQKAPIVGKICMDLIMLDVTALNAKVGDVVIIFDQDNPMELMAKKAESIPYDILSRISSRVKRNYTHN